MIPTVDSLLILASSAVIRDVVQKIYDPNFNERMLYLLGKAVGRTFRPADVSKRSTGASAA